MLDSVTALERF